MSASPQGLVVCFGSLSRGPRLRFHNSSSLFSLFIRYSPIQFSWVIDFNKCTSTKGHGKLSPEPTVEKKSGNCLPKGTYIGGFCSSSPCSFRVKGATGVLVDCCICPIQHLINSGLRNNLTTIFSVPSRETSAFGHQRLGSAQQQQHHQRKIGVSVCDKMWFR